MSAMSAMSRTHDIAHKGAISCSKIVSLLRGACFVLLENGGPSSWITDPRTIFCLRPPRRKPKRGSPKDLACLSGLHVHNLLQMTAFQLEALENLTNSDGLQPTGLHPSKLIT